MSSLETTRFIDILALPCVAALDNLCQLLVSHHQTICALKNTFKYEDAEQGVTYVL